MRRSPVALATCALLAVTAPAACGGGGGVDPTALLAQAKRAVDASPSLHFTLSSGNLPPTGLAIASGHGDARRPDGFSGTFEVRAGVPLDVQVVSVHGVFYDELPFSTAFHVDNPANLGFGDPSKLLSTQHGLTALLVQTSSASAAGTDRLNGEELDEVHVTVAGKLVGALLPDSDTSQDVTGTVGIDPQSKLVRRVVIRGPFFAPDQQSTFTLLLDNYGENVTITPPPSAG